MKGSGKWLMYAEIQRYKEMGLNVSQIARALNVSRNTIYKYLKLTPEEVVDLSKGNRKKKLDDYKEIILDWLETFPDLSAAQIYDWLLEKCRYRGACETTVRNYVRELRELYQIPKVKSHRSYESLEDPLWVSKPRWILEKSNSLMNKEKISKSGS